jgi:hypothetical protein
VPDADAVPRPDAADGDADRRRPGEAAAEGVERAEYTIGVSGCGERKTFVVLCPEGGDGCFAAGPGGFLKGEANQ